MQNVNLHDLPFTEPEYRYGDDHPVHCLSVVIEKVGIPMGHVTMIGIGSLGRVVQEFVKLCIASSFLTRLRLYLCIRVLALALAGTGGRGRRSGVLGGGCFLATDALG